MSLETIASAVSGAFSPVANFFASLRPLPQKVRATVRLITHNSYTATLAVDICNIGRNPAYLKAVKVKWDGNEDYYEELPLEIDLPVPAQPRPETRALKVIPLKCKAMTISAPNRKEPLAPNEECTFFLRNIDPKFLRKLTTNRYPKQIWIEIYSNVGLLCKVRGKEVFWKHFWAFVQINCSPQPATKA